MLMLFILYDLGGADDGNDLRVRPAVIEHEYIAMKTLAPKSVS